MCNYSFCCFPLQLYFFHVPVTAMDITPAANTTVVGPDLNSETVVPKAHEIALQDIGQKGAETVAKIVTTTVKSAVEAVVKNNAAANIAEDAVQANPS